MLVNGWIDAHAHFYQPEDDSQRLAALSPGRSAG